MAVRQTSCKHCGQDIEGFHPYRRGDWRDRGNNTHCPTTAGDAGQVHQPVKEPTHYDNGRRRLGVNDAEWRLLNARHAARHLREVLAYCKAGGMVQTARKVRSCIKSADGAVRNAERFV